MNTNQNNRSCINCGKPLRGRSDKKYCDDLCRNQYNNKNYAPDNSIVRRVNSTLRRNRRILEELHSLRKRNSRVNKEVLIRSGFHFKFATHKENGKKGGLYQFCYEYGYADLGNGQCLVVKSKDAPKVQDLQ
jgi:hypothetical protein